MTLLSPSDAFPSLTFERVGGGRLLPDDVVGMASDVRTHAA